MTDDREGSTGAGAPGASGSGIVELGRAECLELLESQRLCILATADADEPYAIPMFYGFDGAEVFLGISEGRKTRILDANPKVCLTVTEVGPGDGWRAVVVSGRAAWITGEEDRRAAIGVLMAHNRRFASARPPADAAGGSAPPRRHNAGRLMRVADATITGRAKR